MTKSDQDAQALVKQLIAIHGEEGICPTAEDWGEILELSNDKAITILNLLKFKSEIETPEGVNSGLSAYTQYSAKVASAFARVGGKLVFFGKVGHIFPSAAAANWDAAILTRYPSPQALADFWLDQEFIDAHTHRVDGVDRSQVIVMNAMPPPR